MIKLFKRLKHLFRPAPVTVYHVRAMPVDYAAKRKAMIADVAGQTKWHGLTLNVDDWKLIFLNGLNAEMRIVPNWNGDGFVNLGRKTSQLTIAQMVDMIELIYAFGDTTRRRLER